MERLVYKGINAKNEIQKIVVRISEIMDYLAETETTQRLGSISRQHHIQAIKWVKNETDERFRQLRADIESGKVKDPAYLRSVLKRIDEYFDKRLAIAESVSDDADAKFKGFNLWELWSKQ